MEQRKAMIGDFLELGASAFASGIAVAIVLAMITLALAGVAQAATSDDISRAPVTVALDSEPWSQAPTPIVQDRDAADVDALWAIQASERHGNADLQIALAVLALGITAIVAILGRAASRGKNGIGDEVPGGNLSRTPVLVGVTGFEPAASTSRT
jgi:hypothetical protein